MKKTKNYGVVTQQTMTGVIPGHGRYNPDSSIYGEIEKWARKVGPLRIREPWPRAELSVAWTCFVYLQLNLIEEDPSIRSFLTVLRRTRNGTCTMLRKTSIRHSDFVDRLDFPLLITRTGKPFCGPDLYVFKHALEGGMEFGANTFEHIAHLLARDVKEVAKWYYAVAKRCYPKGVIYTPSDQEFRELKEGLVLSYVRDWIEDEIKKYRKYLDQFNETEGKE